MKNLTQEFQALLDAVERAGGQTALAKKLTAAGRPTSPPQVNQWVKRGERAPAEACPEIELTTGIRCESLRPDVNWQLIRRARTSRA